MEIVNCQIRGPDSQDSLSWVKSHRMDIDGPRWDLRENKRPQGPTNYGQKWGNICLMHQNVKKSNSRRSRNQSLIMPGDYVVFSSLILKTRNSSLWWKMLVESWKFRCQQHCLVKLHCCRSSRETCRTLGGHKTKYACIVEAAESVRIRMEGAPHRYHEDHTAGKGMTSSSHNNLVHKCIPMPQAIKISDANAAVENSEKNWRKRHGIWRMS